jgi:SP family general alpha glucoside:H+ symporter-like MFS transporter
MGNKELAKSLSPGNPVSAEIEDLSNAQDANAFEHDLTFFQALRLYPTGVIWSIVMSTAVIMEGYDTKLVGTLYAQPAFQKAFGNLVKGDRYQISAPWQAGLNNGSIIGQLAGLLLAGYICERYGFRASMMWSLLVIIAFVFITFFAKSLVVLLIGQILFGWGSHFLMAANRY